VLIHLFAGREGCNPSQAGPILTHEIADGGCTAIRKASRQPLRRRIFRELDDGGGAPHSRISA